MHWLPAGPAAQEGRKGGFSGAFLQVRARSGRLFWKLFREKGAVLMRQNGADGQWKCVCGKREDKMSRQEYNSSIIPQKCIG